MTMRTKDKNTTEPRIPKALQAVFISSNQGVEVHEPPPERVACKSFFRNRIFSNSKHDKRSSKRPSISVATISCEDESSMASLRSSSNSNSNSSSSSNYSVSSSPQRRHRPSILNSISTTFSSSNHGTNPQIVLDKLLCSRGYSTKPTRTLETAYYNHPTTLQVASYDVHLINLMRDGKYKALRDLFVCGISPNPCNERGESLLHAACRRGDSHLVRLMVQEQGTRVQVADDCGRTPLHDACSSVVSPPPFDIIKLLLDEAAEMMHLADLRGALPLAYVRKEHWPQWVDFLQAHVDTYWPHRQDSNDAATANNGDGNVNVDDSHRQSQASSSFLKQPPHSRPILSPPQTADVPLTLEVVRLVAAGRLSAADAAFLKHKDLDLLHKMKTTTNNKIATAAAETTTGCWTEQEIEDDSSWSSFDLSEQGHNQLCEESKEFDAEEMADLLHNLSV